MSRGSRRFLVRSVDGRARRGILSTPHGTVQTPAFMPVGTHAGVKACLPSEVAQAGAEMILANFYHLALRPGVALVAELGGLHRFMGWGGPILTDSGGYQLVSLQHLARIEDAGVAFRSPYTGEAVELSPEEVVRGQLALGSDVIMCLDHPVAYGVGSAEAEDATRRTHIWAQRCREVDTEDRLLFGIVQGGFEVSSRSRSAALVGSLGFDGVALGGLVLGEPAPVRQLALDACVAELPEQLPRYVMGLGTDLDLLDAVARGVDLFDCVLPTRLGRSGTALTTSGRLALSQARYRRDPGPLEEGCDCPACSGFSRAYLRHLFAAREILGHRLVSLHNIRHLERLMAGARAAIEEGQLASFAAAGRRRLGGARAESGPGGEGSGARGDL